VGGPRRRHHAGPETKEIVGVIVIDRATLQLFVCE
jgi:hypothetical protein